jgi:hypothetical protein
MRICPRCNTENEDKYLYCVGCQELLPKRSRLDTYMARGISSLEARNYRDAYNYFSELVKLNPGDKSVYLLKGLVARALRLNKEMKTCYDLAGVNYIENDCKYCRGLGKCTLCAGTKICTLCNNLRKCTLCNGRGTCPSCKGRTIRCSMCNGMRTCVRCKGSGECVYCEGMGVCNECRGTGLCGKCGGTRKYIELDVTSVPENLRKYLVHIQS